MSIERDEALHAERRGWYRQAGVNQMPAREPQVIHALTLWQPWASAMEKGIKTHETRSWRCPLEPGSLLAIHAAKTIPPHIHQWLYRDQDPGAKALREIMQRHALMPDTLPYGAVVAVVRFQENLSTGVSWQKQMSPEWIEQLSWEEINLGDYSHDRFAWRCELLHRFEEPIPATGRQGLWKWTVPAGALEGVTL